ncbi:MAG: DUF58 domain-containing protein [Anaerolineae bacterium]|nr:DUF58 domain-containing protein [Chloroflexota bacterium]MBP6298445.1 DUF58 domain-containing protein [Anaerolineae bacterium]
MSADSLLLEESIRRKIEPLSLVAKRVRAGAMKGDRRSKKRGTSVEFADYRNYTPGDDLRRLDWNVYARHDKAVVKLLEDEEDLAVHIVVDTSASMDFPKDSENLSQNKLLFAKRLAAAISYIALGENDRIQVMTVGAGQTFGPSRGRTYTVRMLKFLHGLNGGGTTDLNQVLSEYAARAARPGILFLISDFFSENGYINGLNQLTGRGYEVVIIHLLAPDEADPQLAGDLRLVDSETGTPQEVSLDAGLVSLYRQRLDLWQAEIRAECLKRGAAYVSVTTDTPWERVILQDLRRLGVIK